MAIKAGKMHGYDMGGATMPPGFSNYAANPNFASPFLGLQIPQFIGPGGYSKPATQYTPPGQVAMAMQPRAEGGGVEVDPVANARAILASAQRAFGVEPNSLGYRGPMGKLGGMGPMDLGPMMSPMGPVQLSGPQPPSLLDEIESGHRKGGEGLDVSGEAKKLLRLVRKVEAENPGLPAYKLLTYCCQKSPQLSRLCHKIIQGGDCSRSGTYATLVGALRRWSGQVTESGL
jgi:hypothetical protein